MRSMALLAKNSAVRKKGRVRISQRTTLAHWLIKWKVRYVDPFVHVPDDRPDVGRTARVLSLAAGRQRRRLRRNADGGGY